MALIPYNKPYASVAQRIAHLRARGLHIPRPTVATRKIELIGYERLRIYFLSRRQLGVPNRPFAPNTSYMDILKLYESDRVLRDLCFHAVGQFELLLRNTLSEVLSRSHGSHPYFDLTAFKNAPASVDALGMFIRTYEKSRDRRAKHYAETYSSPALPPIWTMKEFLTFGATSRILQNLSGPIRTAIAAEFGVSKDTVFTNWVECLVDLRNICAHHDRLFNRSFQKQLKTLTSATLPTAPPNKLKAALECLDHLLDHRGASLGVTNKALTILNRYPQIQLAEAGF